MKCLSIKVFICVFLIMDLGYSQKLNIIPIPVSEEQINEKYVIKNGSDIILSSENKELRKIAELLKKTVYNRSGVIVNIKNGNTGNGIILNLINDNSIKNEGYQLFVNNSSVKINGKDCKGIFYATQTLQEILKKDTCLYLPGCKITDYPRYEYRGFMLDASRHFQTVDYVKKVIDVMAVLKLNVFHWHLTNDQGWRIESRKYPKLNTIGSFRDSLNAIETNGYYTIAELKDIIQYAKERCIKIIPEVEMPAHSQAAMDSYPELLCPTNKGGNTFCAGNPKSYEFLKNVLDEVIDIFNTDIIVVGGDERPKDIWEKCPLCKKMIASKNLDDVDMLQKYFTKDICDYLSTKGIKTIQWAWTENFKGGYPDNQILENAYPDVLSEATERKYYTISANCLYTYFDYPSSSEEKKSKPDWMPILDLEKVYSFDPTPDSLPDNSKKYIIGSESALWNEFVQQHDIQYHIFPRILAFTEVAWSPVQNKDYKNFVKRVNGIKPFINSMGFEFDSAGW